MKPAPKMIGAQPKRATNPSGFASPLKRDGGYLAVRAAAQAALDRRGIGHTQTSSFERGMNKNYRLDNF